MYIKHLLLNLFLFKPFINLKNLVLYRLMETAYKIIVQLKEQIESTNNELNTLKFILGFSVITNYVLYNLYLFKGKSI